MWVPPRSARTAIMGITRTLARPTVITARAGSPEGYSSELALGITTSTVVRATTAGPATVTAADIADQPTAATATSVAALAHIMVETASAGAAVSMVAVATSVVVAVSTAAVGADTAADISPTTYQGMKATAGGEFRRPLYSFCEKFLA